MMPDGRLTPAPPSLDQTQRVSCGALALAVVGYAAFTLLVLIARLRALPFTVVVAGAMVIGVSVLVIGTRRCWSTRALWSRQPVLPPALLLALMLACGTITCLINAPEEDDAAYVPPAVAALAHPDLPMRLDLTWIVPFSNGVTPRADLGVLFNSVEIFWACVSRVTGIPLLTLYQAAGAFVFGAAFPLVYFVLLTRLDQSTQPALIGGLAATLAAFLLFRAAGIGYGMVFSKIWIGKAILEAIVIPTVAGFVFAFARQPSTTRWGLLLASVFAATGCSSSSLPLVPAVLLALTPGAAWQIWSAGEVPRGRLWLRTLAIPTVAAYPLAVGAFFYARYAAVIVGDTTSRSSLAIFNTGFRPYFGTWHSVTSIVVCLTAGSLVMWRRREHVPLLCWFATAIAIFTNPWFAGVLARHLTSEALYNRLFWVIPVPGLTGLVAAHVAGRRAGRFTPARLAVMMLAAAGLYAALVGPSRLPLDVPKFHVLGSPRLGPPFVRVDPDLLSDVRDLAATLPPGNTLAAVDYELALSMTTTQLPQYSLWPMDMIMFYGNMGNASADAGTRYKASRFLIGQTRYRGSFEALLDTPVRNVILSHRLVSDVSLMKAAVTGKGFTLVKETSRYVSYTRSGR